MITKAGLSASNCDIVFDNAITHYKRCFGIDTMLRVQDDCRIKTKSIGIEGCYILFAYDQQIESIRYHYELGYVSNGFWIKPGTIYRMVIDRWIEEEHFLRVMLWVCNWGSCCSRLHGRD